MGNINYGVIKDNKLEKIESEGDAKGKPFAFESYYQNGLIELDLNLNLIVEMIKSKIPEDSHQNIMLFFVIASTFLSSVILIKKPEDEKEREMLDLNLTLLIPLDYFDEEKIPNLLADLTREGIINLSKPDENVIKQKLPFILSLFKKDKYYKVRISNVIGKLLEIILDSIPEIIKLIGENNSGDGGLENIKKLISLIYTKFMAELVSSQCHTNLKDSKLLKFRINGEDIDWCNPSTEPPKCPECPKCETKECPVCPVCPECPECPEDDNTIFYGIIGVLSVLLVVLFLMYLNKK
jgi:hypothetical protein